LTKYSSTWTVLAGFLGVAFSSSVSLISVSSLVILSAVSESSLLSAADLSFKLSAAVLSSVLTAVFSDVLASFSPSSGLISLTSSLVVALSSLSLVGDSVVETSSVLLLLSSSS
jgi:hypothetical protein